MSEVETKTNATSARPTPNARLILNTEAFGTAHSVESIVDMLQERGIAVDVAFVTAETLGTDLARTAATEGCPLVIAVGGDGTIHQVAVGLLHSSTQLGIIPLGTMNNLAFSLNIPTDIGAACDVIAGGKWRPIDVGMVNGKPFLEVVSIGAEASFFPLAESIRHHGALGAIRGLIQGIRLLTHLQMHPVTVQLDNKRRRTHSWQITVCNAPVYGLRFAAAPQARMDDGLLDVVITSDKRRWDLVQHYRSIMTGQRIPSLRENVERARRVRVASHYPLPVAADGVTIGTTPVQITVARGALHILSGTAEVQHVNEPTLSPLALVARSLASSDESDTTKVHTATETVARMQQLAKLYWFALPVLLFIGTALRWLRIWPFQQLSAEKQVTVKHEPDRTLVAQLTAFSLTPIFTRLQLVLEVVALLFTGLLNPVFALLRLLRRWRPLLMVPDEGTARAVAGTGILAAGLWASRKSTLRRNLFLTGLGAIALWFAKVGRHESDTPERQRDAVALGAGVGAVWLGLSLTAISQVRRSIHQLTAPAVTSNVVEVVKADPHTFPTPPSHSLDIVPIAVTMPLERGDIVLFGPDHSFGANLIEFVTFSYYHHVAIYDGDGMVIEAMPEGVNRYALRDRKVTGIRPNVLPEQRLAAADWARQQAGGVYDTRGLALIAFDRVFPGLRLGNPSAHRFSCAVFIADAYNHAGTDLLPGQRWQSLVPGDFAQLLNTTPQHSRKSYMDINK